MEENPPTPHWNNFSGQTSEIKILQKNSHWLWSGGNLHYVGGGWHWMADIQFVVKSQTSTQFDVSENIFYLFILRLNKAALKRAVLWISWLVWPCNLLAFLIYKPLVFAFHCGSFLRSPEVSTGCSPEPLRNRVQSRLDLLKPKVTWAPPSKSPKSKPSVTSNWIRCTNIENNVFTSCNFSLVLYYLFA